MGEAPEAVFGRAMALAAAGRPGEAAGMLEALAARSPGNPALAHALGAVLHQAGRSAEAVPHLERAARRLPTDPDVRAALAAALRAVGGGEAARPHLAAALRLAPGRSDLWHNAGNLSRALRRDREAVLRYRAALCLEPADADPVNGIALACLAAGDSGQAERAAHRLLALAPGDAAGLGNRALALHRLGRHAESRAHWLQLLRRDPLNPSALVGLGDALLGQAAEAEDARLWREGRLWLRRALAAAPGEPAGWAAWADLLIDARADRAAAARSLDLAIRTCERALVASPGFHTARGNRAVLLLLADRPREAAAENRALLAAGQQEALVRYNLAYALLQAGELAEGWDASEARWLPRKGGARLRHRERPLWDGEPRPDARLLVWSEQGIGDAVRFCSCLPEAVARVGHVVVECDARLVGLLGRSFPAAEVRASSATDGEAVRDIDLHLPMGSLPRLFRRTPESFRGAGPYLRPDPALVAAWRARLAALGGRSVGLAWRSRLTRAKRVRHFPDLDDLAPLFAWAAARDVRLVAVQYDDCSAELAGLAARGVRLHRFEDVDLMQDLEQATALSVALDAVVSPPISVADMAAAAGAPTFVFWTPRSDWAFLGETARSPWFPTMRLFTKAYPDPWSRAVEPLVAALDAALA